MLKHALDLFLINSYNPKTDILLIPWVKIYFSKEINHIMENVYFWLSTPTSFDHYVRTLPIYFAGTQIQLLREVGLSVICCGKYNDFL